MAIRPTGERHHMRQVVIGLAGHIDHGKSALVEQLTGDATDRRPEEQRRGMTVDLGFAHFDAGACRFALIDVPGHDRFVHNMVSGVVGVQLGMLVVAADDSVMPQTREHLDILDLLGVPGGVVVVTKFDLVDAGRLEVVRHDVARLVAGTTFAHAPMIAVSNVDGRGIDEVRRSLVAQADQLPPPDKAEGPFRMPIDRVFTLPGHGTVATGTVRRGTIKRGETLELLPRRTRVKVRQLQCQGREVLSVTVGERAALNLAGVKVSQMGRGDEIVSENTCETTGRLLIALRVLPRLERGIANREEVRLHIGTREVTARLRISQPEAKPGEQLIAVVDCPEPVVAEFSQPVILRRLSPAQTLGGGRVLFTRAAPNRRLARLWEVGEQLAQDAVEKRLLACLSLCGPTNVNHVMWPLEIGSTTTEVQRCADNLCKQEALVRLPRDANVVLTSREWRSLIENIQRQCERESRRRRPQRWIPRMIITQRFEKRYDPAVTHSAMDELVHRRQLESRDAEIALADRLQLSRQQQQLLELLEADVVSGGATPPMKKELAERHHCTVKEITPLLERLIDDARLVRVSEELAVEREVLQSLLESLRELLAGRSTVTVADVRDCWQVTRKHALPYLQYCDEAGYTERSGTVRVPGPNYDDLPHQGPNS